LELNAPVLEFLSAAPMRQLIENYGLAAVFGVVALESFGIPLPGETALVAAALYAGSNHTSHVLGIIPVIAVAAAGATAGGSLGYVLGRAVGLRLLIRYGKYIWLNERRLKLGQYLFLTHGGKIVFFGRFVALLRTFASLLAGANRMGSRRFLLMNALGAAGWAALLGVGAYLFGRGIERVAGPISILVLIGVAVAIVVAFLFIRRHEKELEDRAELALPGPLRH
jgi:membrane protein DedA with SNARE-associated domain